MNCPNCGKNEKQTILVPVGWKTNPYGLYFCADCKAILTSDENGNLRVVSTDKLPGFDLA